MAWHWIALHGILRCMAFHDVALPGMALHGIAWHGIGLHCIVFLGVAWHCMARHLIRLHVFVYTYGAALYGVAFHRNFVFQTRPYSAADFTFWGASLKSDYLN